MGDLTRDLYEAAAAVREQGERLARGSGQTLARWQVLYLLDEKPLTVPTVARRLGLARQSVQRVADRLVAERLLQRLDNPDHLRSSLYALTGKGEDVLVSINRAAAAWHREVLRAVSPSELRQAQQFLKTMARLARSARAR